MMLAPGLGRGISLTALTVLFLLFSPVLNYQVAFAQFPIANPGTEGFEVIVSSTSPVIATYQGNSATFSNDLYLVVDGNPANDRFIFNNKTSPVGSTANLGSFPVGTKLLFRLHVRDTGKDYFTGAGSRNPDNKPHARAQANWKPNETLVSFEDLLNGPFEYNDLSFSFVPTTAVQGIVIDVASTKGWQSTSLKVTQGQQLSFSAVGSWTVDFRNFPNVGPDGYSPDVDRTIYQGCKLNSILPYSVLLVRIGDDDPTFIAIGSKGEFPAYREGFLEFRIHDGDACLADNAGSVKVTVTAPQLILRQPAGVGSNLVVLVHGCCTDANDVRKDWDSFGRDIAGTIQTPGAWEIVVWDWSNETSKISLSLNPPSDAYENAVTQGHNLATAILNISQTYKYIHLIGHSAGSRLIQQAAKELANYYRNQQNKPFIHLTFLDAFTPTPPLGDYQDSGENAYGFLEGNPHYSEQYVNRGTPQSPDFPFTDTCLNNAFNFNITDWENNDKNLLPASGHFWPVHWYKQSVTGSGFKYGFPLSFEGGVQTYTSLFIDYPNGFQCGLTVNTKCKTGTSVLTDSTYRCW